MTEYITERGGEIWLSAGALILIAGDAAYHGETDQARHRGTAMLDAILGAAYRAGFAKCDLLRTLLFTGEIETPRVRALCKEAADRIPREALLAAMRSAGFDSKERQ